MSCCCARTSDFGVLQIWHVINSSAFPNWHAEHSHIDMADRCFGGRRGTAVTAGRPTPRPLLPLRKFSLVVLLCCTAVLCRLIRLHSAATVHWQPLPTGTGTRQCCSATAKASAGRQFACSWVPQCHEPSTMTTRRISSFEWTELIEGR
jgi:hypothetical protein